MPQGSSIARSPKELNVAMRKFTIDVNFHHARIIILISSMIYTDQLPPPEYKLFLFTRKYKISQSSIIGYIIIIVYLSVKIPVLKTTTLLYIDENNDNCLKAAERLSVTFTVSINTYSQV